MKPGYLDSDARVHRASATTAASTDDERLLLGRPPVAGAPGSGTRYISRPGNWNARTAALAFRI